MDPEKIKVILEWPNLMNVTDVLSFLGMVNFYHKHLAQLTKMAILLSILLKEENPFIWGPKQVHAFKTVKCAVTDDLILAHFVQTDPVDVHCNASNKAVTSIMIQNGHPVIFESQKLSATKLNYLIHDKELLAIIHALMKWHTYLHSSPILIKILTDHKSLVSCDTTNPKS